MFVNTTPNYNGRLPNPVSTKDTGPVCKNSVSFNRPELLMIFLRIKQRQNAAPYGFCSKFL